MTADLPEYELYAIRYATREARRADHFIGGDPHDAPMPMDYFVWLAKGAGRVVVIDAGFTEPVARKRKRTFLRCPVEALALFGVRPEDVQDVVLTHLHYDHVGNFHLFPHARFHLQEPELHFAVGRYMKYRQLAHSFEVDDVVGLVRLNYAGRVNLLAGRFDLAPGIELRPAPGHSAGLQFLRIHTQRGWVVLASDVTHYYEHMETYRPFTTALHIGQMMEGFDLLRAAAPSMAHIVPGHDPEVMRRYKPPRPELEGIAVRLDVAPLE
ncbi:MAG TPA: N-acyl homoserine lactonase family protein [Acetobacteraceae bacterium]|nr:N-acyl homoserine lactonase family protein [Acetobacteraceae bacterium]